MKPFFDPTYPLLSSPLQTRLEAFKFLYTHAFSRPERERLLFADYLLDRGKLNEGTPALRREQARGGEGERDG